jgi:hypothetical protein
VASLEAGQSLHETGRAFGKEHSSIRCLVSRHRGFVPAVRRSSLLALTLIERENISRWIASGSSIRNIARHLERAASTVSREVARHMVAVPCIGPPKRIPRPGSRPCASSHLINAVEAHNDSISRSSAAEQIDLAAVQQRISARRAKKNRILETFYEGIIDRVGRDEAIANVEREVDAYRGVAGNSVLQRRELSLANLDLVLQIVGPLAEWDFLTREERRSLLRHLCPEISVFRYTVKALTLNLRGLIDESPDGYKNSHSR